MELWGWLVGYVVLFALLHLLLYYVHVRRGGDDRSPRPSFADRNGASPPYTSGPEGTPRSPDEREDHLDADHDTVRCPHCGHRNELDAVYTYCRHCVNALNR